MPDQPLEKPSHTQGQMEQGTETFQKQLAALEQQQHELGQALARHEKKMSTGGTLFLVGGSLLFSMVFSSPLLLAASFFLILLGIIVYFIGLGAGTKVQKGISAINDQVSAINAQLGK